MLEILLVDDEAWIVQILGNGLRAQGHSVAITSDGAKALDLAAHHSFDALMCDVRMPEVDDLSLLRQMRSLHPDTAVILMTARPDVRQAVSALHAGAFDYLVKPFTLTQALERLDHLPRHEAIRPLNEALGQFERGYLQRALTTTHGRKGATAKLLGISRKNLWEKLRRHQLSQGAEGETEVPTSPS